MKTDELMKQLSGRIESYEELPWMSDYTEFGSFRPEGALESGIHLDKIGRWLRVYIVFTWEGTTMDQTTDRLGGDPYHCIVSYDWIGLNEKVPKKVSTPEELSEWAIISLKYVREYTDVGVWGVHQGSWVEDTKYDGTIKIRDVKGVFQDEDPQSLGETRIVQLKNFL